jgi:hypothetical protein
LSIIGAGGFSGFGFGPFGATGLCCNIGCGFARGCNGGRACGVYGLPSGPNLAFEVDGFCVGMPLE